VKNIFLTVIVPCYNEEANLNRGVLRRIYEYISHHDFAWEVIVSDDGSTDKSLDIIKKQVSNFENFIVLENPHGGKPSALNYGIKAACGKYVLFCDMDQSTPIEELDKLLPYVKEDYAAVIGSRGMDRENFPFYRKLGSSVFANFRKLFLLHDINDTQCGFKLFKKSVLIKTFPKLEFFRKEREVKGWTVTSFDVELLHLVEKIGGKVMEVKVVWKDEDISISKGGAKQKYIKESIDMFKQILRVKINDIRGMYSDL
jgi:glycosyltransferase involved in cell wall biosynthesis